MVARLDDGWKELIKWLIGIVGAIMVMGLKNSYDKQTETNKQLQQKVDKVYDYSTNHEVRMAVIEKEIEEHKKKILDLQLARERSAFYEQNINLAKEQLKATE
jgi:predicted  nucleic acid-binding Zn-ribbon protein